MALEIKNLTGIPSDSRTLRTRATEAVRGSAAAGSLDQKGVDSITFTDTAVSLQRMHSVLRDLPIVNKERVSAIRDEINAGVYRIDHARVAEKLFAFEVQYLGANAHDRFYASA